MRVAVLLLAAVLAVSAISIETSEPLPVSEGPELESLKLDSDLTVVKTLQVVASRVSRGRQGAATGFKLLISFLKKKANKVERKAENFRDAIELYKKRIVYLDSVISRSKTDLKDVRAAITDVKKAVLEENLSPRVLQEVNQILSRHSNTDDVGFLELEEHKDIPNDTKDSGLQKLKTDEQKAEEAAKDAEQALASANKKLREARETRRLLRIKTMEAKKAKLEYIEKSLVKRIQNAQTGIERMRKNIQTVDAAIARHQTIIQVTKKLINDLNAANVQKLKIYDDQIAMVQSVSQVLKLGLDLTQYAPKSVQANVQAVKASATIAKVAAKKAKKSKKQAKKKVKVTRKTLKNLQADLKRVQTALNAARPAAVAPNASNRAINKYNSLKARARSLKNKIKRVRQILQRRRKVLSAITAHAAAAQEASDVAEKAQKVVKQVESVASL